MIRLLTSFNHCPYRACHLSSQVTILPVESLAASWTPKLAQVSASLFPALCRIVEVPAAMSSAVAWPLTLESFWAATPSGVNSLPNSLQHIAVWKESPRFPPMGTWVASSSGSPPMLSPRRWRWR